MNKIASIEKIKSVCFHPNADRLDFFLNKNQHLGVNT